MFLVNNLLKHWQFITIHHLTDHACIFLVDSRCTASVSHYFPDEAHMKKYCHSLNAQNCPIVLVYVTRPGAFTDGW